MTIHVRDLLKEFPDLLTLIKGSPESPISALKDPQIASKTDLIFAFTAKHLKEAEASQAQTWIVHKDLSSAAKGATVIASDNPQLAMARIAKKFFPQTAHHQPIKGDIVHSSARVSPLARLGVNCIIGPGAVIADGCEISDNCIIGAKRGP